MLSELTSPMPSRFKQKIGVNFPRKESRELFGSCLKVSDILKSERNSVDNRIEETEGVQERVCSVRVYLGMDEKRQGRSTAFYGKK